MFLETPPPPPITPPAGDLVAATLTEEEEDERECSIASLHQIKQRRGRETVTVESILMLHTTRFLIKICPRVVKFAAERSSNSKNKPFDSALC